MNAQLSLDYFDNIYNNTYDAVLKYVLCKCYNPDDVNDIIQDIYLELCKVLEKNSRLVINDMTSFIIGIAKNKVKQYIGTKYKQQGIMSFSDDSSYINNEVADSLDILDTILTKDDISKVRKFINNKKPIPRKIFYLYYYFDMPLSDIAMELKMNVSTVKSQLYRMVNDLNIYFKKEGRINE